MSSETYTVWCEWDIGWEDQVFESKKDAMTWFKNNDLLRDLCYQFDSSIEQMIDMGHLSINLDD